MISIAVIIYIIVKIMKSRHKAFFLLTIGVPVSGHKVFKHHRLVKFVGGEALLSPIEYKYFKKYHAIHPTCNYILKEEKGLV